MKRSRGTEGAPEYSELEEFREWAADIDMLERITKCMTDAGTSYIHGKSPSKFMENYFEMRKALMNSCRHLIPRWENRPNKLAQNSIKELSERTLIQLHEKILKELPLDPMPQIQGVEMVDVCPSKEDIMELLEDEGEFAMVSNKPVKLMIGDTGASQSRVPYYHSLRKFEPLHVAPEKYFGRCHLWGIPVDDIAHEKIVFVERGHDEKVGIDWKIAKKQYMLITPDEVARYVNTFYAEGYRRIPEQHMEMFSVVNDQPDAVMCNLIIADYYLVEFPKLEESSVHHVHAGKLQKHHFKNRVAFVRRFLTKS